MSPRSGCARLTITIKNCPQARDSRWKGREAPILTAATETSSPTRMLLSNTSGNFCRSLTKYDACSYPTGGRDADIFAMRPEGDQLVHDLPRWHAQMSGESHPDMNVKPGGSSDRSRWTKA